jgi:hypothetical protein
MGREGGGGREIEREREREREIIVPHIVNVTFSPARGSWRGELGGGGETAARGIDLTRGTRLATVTDPFPDTARTDKSEMRNGRKERERRGRASFRGRRMLNKTRDVDGVPISFVAACRRKADGAVSRLLALAAKSFN